MVVGRRHLPSMKPRLLGRGRAGVYGYVPTARADVAGYFGAEAVRHWGG
jgi:hypothetical protein